MRDRLGLLLVLAAGGDGASGSSAGFSASSTVTGSVEFTVTG